MSTDCYIKLENVSRKYTKGGILVEALKYASCSVLPNDRIAVTGPSGSGKSSLLHIMAGLDMPTAGNISWPLFGDRATLRPVKIGFISQAQSLVTSLNTVENVALPLVLDGRNFDEARESAMALLKRMNLAEISEKLPGELSGGQLQRAAIARALITNPRVILADEPTGQLDHPTAKHLLDILFEYICGTDTALVVATHDMEVAGRMATRWRIHFGELEVEPV